MSPYTVPESKRSLHQNQFEFQVPGDDTIHRIPKMKYLPVGTIEKMALAGKNVTISDLIALFDGDNAAAAHAVRQLDTEQLQDLTEAWQKDSGITVGESSASTDS